MKYWKSLAPETILMTQNSPEKSIEMLWYQDVKSNTQELALYDTMTL